MLRRGLKPGVDVQDYGTYYVTWDNGCAASVTDTIHVNPCVDENAFKMPNIITPNGDGVNDGIDINLLGITELRVQILNRWGEIVSKVAVTGDGY